MSLKKYIKILIFSFGLMMAMNSNSQTHSKASIQNKNSETKTDKKKQQARNFLETALKRYQTQALRFDVKKKFMLPVIDEVAEEKGYFYIQKGHFKFSIDSEPAYLMVFDGKYLWHQADLKEKLVFKLEDHPHLQLFLALFHPKRFFDFFKIQSFERESSRFYTFHLLSKGQIPGLKELHISVGKYLQTAKIVWEDGDQWQEYRFLKPWEKAQFHKSVFQFQTKDFEILTSNNF